MHAALCWLCIQVLRGLLPLSGCDTADGNLSGDNKQANYGQRCMSDSASKHIQQSSVQTQFGVIHRAQCETLASFIEVVGALAAIATLLDPHLARH